MGDRDKRTAATLVLVSAFMHASWNLAARAVKGDTSILVLGVTCAAPAFLGLALIIQFVVRKHEITYVDDLKAGWVYILVTGIVHALYIILLSHSYKIGDLTIVYPIARGSSVAFVAIFSHLIIPHYRISTLGSAGIAMVVAGICFMAVKSREFKCRKPHGEKNVDVNVPMRKLEETPTATASTGDCNNSNNNRDVPVDHAVDMHFRMNQQQVLVAVGFALTVGTCTAVSSFTVCCALVDRSN